MRIEPVLLVLFMLSLQGCQKQIPTYAERERAGEVPVIQMENSADEGKEPVDVAALVHDLRVQLSDLEKNFSGENPDLGESLLPIGQSLDDVQRMIENLKPILAESQNDLEKLQEEIDTLRGQIQE